MTKNVIFIVVVLSVFLTLYLLSTKNVMPIPSDDVHAPVTSEKECFDCHRPDLPKEQGKKHPPKFECFKCHMRADK